MIKAAGGIIFAKTAQSQLALSVETNNLITGRASSTYNSLRTSGGSSGGQGVAISSRCCIVGLGSDTGGSIRIPCNNNGVYGYKSSTRRMCGGGSDKFPLMWFGQNNIVGLSGPMGNQVKIKKAQTVDDLVLMLQTLWNPDVYSEAPTKSRQLTFKPTKWNDKVYDSRNKLRIGYIQEYELLPTCATTHRAIELAKKALESQGHTLVPFTISKDLLEQIFTLTTIFYFEFKTAKQALHGEKLIPELQHIESIQNRSKILLRMQSAYYRMTGQRREWLHVNTAIKHFDSQDLLCASGQQIIIQGLMDQEWQKLGINALIQPISASAPLLHGQSENSYVSLIYTQLWNFFDYNTGAVPITVVEAHEQHYDTVDTYSKPDSITQVMRNAMKDSLGLPVGIQVVTQPTNDELCLSLMKQIEEKVQFKNSPLIIV